MLGNILALVVFHCECCGVASNSFWNTSLPGGGEFAMWFLSSSSHGGSFKKVTKLSSYKIKIEKYGYKIPHAVMIGYK